MQVGQVPGGFASPVGGAHILRSRLCFNPAIQTLSKGKWIGWHLRPCRLHRRDQEEANMWLEDHFGSGSMLQRNERVKLAASFWNNVGAGMVIGGMAAAFFLDKPQGAWTKIGIAIAGLALGWLCYSIASNILTYMHTAPEERR
jgi:hypothetical protein